MQQDFRKHLRRQLDFLGRSAAAYDAGHADEAVRIATTIRILIHNTQSSTSLLKHLNATTISLMSSCRGAVPNAFLYMGLGMQSAQIDNGVVNTLYTPLFDGPVRNFVPVSKWWDMIVFVLNQTTRLTRKTIVLSAANKDGGAHVDKSLTPEYEALARDGSVGFVAFESGGMRIENPFTQAHFGAIRQMAHELLNSPDLVRLMSAAQ